MKRTAGLIIFGLTLGAGMLLSGSASAFLDMPSLAMVAGLAAGMELIGHHGGTDRNALYLRMKKHSIYAGWLTFIMGLIPYLSSLDGALQYANFSVCLIGILYGYLAGFLFDSFSQ